MAMELLFENHTQLDEDIIHHIIEKDYKRPEKAKQYHPVTLSISIPIYASYVCAVSNSSFLNSKPSRYTILP